MPSNSNRRNNEQDKQDIIVEQIQIQTESEDQHQEK